VNINQVTFQESSRTQFGRLPQFFGTFKATSIFWDKWMTTSIFWQIEVDLNIVANGNDLNILANEDAVKI
jgi:hypothetical protein